MGLEAFRQLFDIETKLNQVYSDQDTLSLWEVSYFTLT